MPKKKDKYSITLYRFDAAVPQSQYRGMVSRTVETQLVLEAATDNELHQMARVAQVDGWQVKAGQKVLVTEWKDSE